MSTYHIASNETNTTLLVEALREAIELYSEGVEYAALRAQDEELYTVTPAPEDFMEKDYLWYYTNLQVWVKQALKEVRKRTGLIFNVTYIEDVKVWTPEGDIIVKGDVLKELIIVNCSGPKPFSVNYLNTQNGYQGGGLVSNFDTLENAIAFIQNYK